MSKTALARAARAWDAVTVARILDADRGLVDVEDRSQRTPLQLCAAIDLRGRPDRIADCLATASVLIDAGATVDHRRVVLDDGEPFPMTALWYAVGYGHNHSLASWLLERGADPAWCLWAAVWNNDAAMVGLLLDAGAPLDAKVHGDTPLVYAARLGRAGPVQLLVHAGASLDACDRHGRTPEQLARSARLPDTLVQLLRNPIERDVPRSEP